MSSLNILLIEDNKHDAVAIRRVLRKNGTDFQVIHHTRAESALEQIRQEPHGFDVVICDHKLPGMTGLEFSKTLIDDGITVPTILLTGQGAESLAVAALKEGVSDYIVKDVEHGYLQLLPVVLPDVVRRHRDRLARFHAEKQLETRERLLAGLVKAQQLLLSFAHSQPLEECYQQIAAAFGEMSHASAVLIFTIHSSHPTHDVASFAGNHVTVRSIIQGLGAVAASDFVDKTIADELEHYQLDWSQGQTAPTLDPLVETNPHPSQTQSSDIELHPLGVWASESDGKTLETQHGTLLNDAHKWELDTNIPHHPQVYQWIHELYHGRCISGTTADLPDELKMLLGKRHVQSFLVFPLFVAQNFFGVMSFENWRDPKLWEPIEVELLRAGITSMKLWHEQRLIEEKLHRYTIELQQQNQELDAFAHTVAHDIKNPLTIISSTANLLKELYDGLSEEEVAELLRNLEQGSHKAILIVEELLTLSSVRQGEVNLQPIDMGDVLANTIQRMSYMLEEHQAVLEMPDEWPTALGHGPWIEEVWVNYVSNAVKYGGRPPKVTLGYDLDVSPLDISTSPHQQWVRFWVKDNGNGLSKEEQDQLFVPFTQLDMRIDGHGLGLSIVRRILERLEGEVAVESEGVPGQGSVFSFTVPLSL